MRRRAFLTATSGSVIGWACGRCPAQEAVPPDPAQRKARLAEIRRITKMLAPRVFVGASGDEGSAAELADEPALLYADNARDTSDSSLWIWRTGGRGVAVCTAEFKRRDADRPDEDIGGFWTFEFAVLTPLPMRVALPDGPWLVPALPNAERMIPDSGPVAGTRVQRLSQMKRLAERFSASSQNPREGRLELRRLAAAVYRQPEASAGDGALFVFATGTNPEIVLSLKTVDIGGESGWGYALGSLSADRLTVELDGHEVWTDERFTMPGTRERYTNGRFRTET
jgi:hypothetical protein